MGKERKWIDSHFEKYKIGKGSTPEEAVANLWLELNSKKTKII